MAATSIKPENATLNADMTARVVIDANTLPWTPSPSGTVWRKRLHLVGGLESGQVTTIVRYDAGATFPAHEHPEGEEILVLQGVFSDEAGDWPVGSYLLNPEGFRHAPFSKPGCIIFVKLRQYAGKRPHVALQTETLPWRPGAEAGVEIKSLYADPAFPETMQIERWRRDCGPIKRSYPAGAEILILEGALEDAAGRHEPLTWLRIPPGGQLNARSGPGARIYVKAGQLPHLRQAGAP